MKKHILISGAGIAGLTAAKLLAKQGHSVTVIDKAQSFNKAGFLISLKSFGVKIMDELGLTKKLQEEASPSETVDFVEVDGQVIQSISYEGMNKGIERSVLISRGGLHHVLYEDVKDEVDLQLNTTIAALEEQDGVVEVLLSNGKVLAVDLVVVAEGLRSPTRDRYFDNCRLADFNTLYLGGKLVQKHALAVGKFKIYVDVNKMLSIYPVSKDEIAIQCYIHSREDIADIRNNAGTILKTSFQDYNQEVRDLLDALLDKGLVFIDKMGMVQAPDLVNGRVVLLGDAGYCPTALSGMGASLSIYGAKALAHFISRQPDEMMTACKQFNTLMQPIIQKFQTNARNNAASFIPKDEGQLARFVASFRHASEVEVQQIMTAPIVLTADQMNFIIN